MSKADVKAVRLFEIMCSLEKGVAYKRVSAMAAEFGVSPRTIQRDLFVIEQHLPITRPEHRGDSTPIARMRC